MQLRISVTVNLYMKVSDERLAVLYIIVLSTQYLERSRPRIVQGEQLKEQVRSRSGRVEKRSLGYPRLILINQLVANWPTLPRFHPRLRQN